MNELYPVAMFVATFIVLLSGFPVAFCLAGTALIFAGLGLLTGHFDSAFLSALPSRIYGIMSNETLIAVPLFVFMGVVLERAKIRDDLPRACHSSLASTGGSHFRLPRRRLTRRLNGHVGATVVTMGLISLPAMQRRNYSPGLSTVIICASGTLGQIIPPSIVLVILGDVVSSAHQQYQLKLGNFSPTSISVGDLFLGALVPGILLMALYILYIVGLGLLSPKHPTPSQK